MDILKSFLYYGHFSSFTHVKTQRIIISLIVVIYVLICIAFQTEFAYALSDQSNETARTLNKKGVDLLGLGSYNEAVQNFDKALAIDPNHTTALKNKQKILDLMK